MRKCIARHVSAILNFTFVLFLGSESVRYRRRGQSCPPASSLSNRAGFSNVAWLSGCVETKKAAQSEPWTVGAFPVALRGCQSGSQHKFNELREDLMEANQNTDRTAFSGALWSAGWSHCWALAEKHNMKRRGKAAKTWVCVCCWLKRICFLCANACICTFLIHERATVFQLLMRVSKCDWRWKQALDGADQNRMKDKLNKGISSHEASPLSPVLLSSFSNRCLLLMSRI